MMQQSTGRSPRKPKGQGAERREEILAAALRLFVEQGIDAVSTRQIAQAVGISQPALYAYFSSKDEIGDELQARAFALLARRLAERGQAPAVGAADVARMLRIYVDFGLENPDMYRIAFMTVRPKPAAPVPSAAPTSTSSTFGVLAGFMADLHERGLADAEDPMAMAQCAWAALHGLVSLLIAKPAFPWIERERLIKTHTLMIARGLLAPGR
jgi:AcrR family transcriptional regulator